MKWRVDPNPWGLSGADPAPGPSSDAAPGDEPVGVVTPGDVLAYRRMWEPWIKAVKDACVAAATAWDAVAAGQTPALACDLSHIQGRANPAILKAAAQAQADLFRTYADNLAGDKGRWNMNAGLKEYEIVILAKNILENEQATVRHASFVLVPELRSRCPGAVIGPMPTLSLQRSVIARIEGLRILAHGALQLFEIGEEGVVRTVGQIAGGTLDVLSSPVTWLAAAAGAGLLVLLAVRKG